MLKAVASGSPSRRRLSPLLRHLRDRHTRALELRPSWNTGTGRLREKVSVNDLIVRACAQALIQHPQAHRSYVDGRHVYHAHVHVGIAVALDDGLIVPCCATPTRRASPDRRRDAQPCRRARDGKLAGPRSRAARSPSRTWACSTSPPSRPSSTRPSRRSWPCRAGRARRRPRRGRRPRKIVSVTLSCDRGLLGADGRGCCRRSTAASRRRPSCSHDPARTRTLDPDASSQT